jgi:phage shock protein PspC (stress-responsive transcriptional regulator)
MRSHGLVGVAEGLAADFGIDFGVAWVVFEQAADGNDPW